MKLLRLWFVKRTLPILLCLSVGLTVQAESRHRYANNGINHSIGLSLQAGEANMVATSDVIPVKLGLGGDAQVGLSYELQKKKFFFNIGVNAHYSLTQNKMNDLVDAFEQPDYELEPVLYRYHYPDLKELQQTFTVGVPVQFGWYFPSDAYIAVGVKAEYPFYHPYVTEAHMFTDGVYDRLIEPLRNDANYGYYELFDYARTGAYMVNKVCPWVTPSLEAGAMFRLRKKVSLRLGGYVEYGIPIQPQCDMVYADYSQVNQTPQGRTLGDLKANLVLNSILDYEGLKHSYGHLAVGVKATFLFHLKKKQPCVTCDDDSGIPYRFVKK